MRIILLTVFLCCAMGQPCYATGVQEQIAREIHAEAVLQAVPGDVQDLLGAYDFQSGQGAVESLQVLWEQFTELVQNHFFSALKPAGRTLMIVILSSILSAMIPGEKGSFPIIMAGGAAIIYLTLADTRSYFSDCVSTIQRMYEFSTALFPCLAGASVFAGAAISSGVKYTAAALFMNLLLNFCNSFLLPLITVYLVCMIGHTLFDQQLMGTVSNFIRRLCTAALTGCVVVFTAYLSIAGLITSSGELFTARLTKTAISAGLPIVGKIISDSASTLVAGACVLRNGIGVLGMLVIIGILLVPFVSMGTRYLLFKAVGELAELFPITIFPVWSKAYPGLMGCCLL